MKVSTKSFSEGQRIPAKFAFCDYGDPVSMAPNVSPQLSWSAPPGTKSFVLLLHDPDVPSVGDDVNQPDREVPADLPRVDFFHCVLVDIPATKTEFVEGELSDGITARGKSGPAFGEMRHGLNDYTGWFVGDPDMEGDYFGYDGPCPPWNDSIVHHYHFTVYALDVAKCSVEGTFNGHDVREAIEGRVIASASVMGTYSLNKSYE